MREIENIFLSWKDYNCFACSPQHQIGLRMRFFYDDETGIIHSRIDPRTDLEGFPGILHGGLQSTILDEVGFWALYAKTERLAVTARLSIEFIKPVTLRQVLTGYAKMNKDRGRIAYVDAWLEDEKGVVLSKADIVYYYTTREFIESTSRAFCE